MHLPPRPLVPGLLALLSLSAPLLAQDPAKPLAITLKTLTAQMKFDRSEIVIAPGTKVKLSFENPDDMPHNVVFCQPGTNVEALVMKMLEKPEEAMKRNFLPDDPAVWLKSRLLNPHESQEIEFTAPEKPGRYPYVCSFPGHAMTMKGILHVIGEGPALQDLHFSLYHGDWKQLPDFSKLTPHREGAVPDNLVQLNFDDYKNQFGMVFTGKLKAPASADYEFFLASDDGGRLLIDGEEWLKDDGIHPANTKSKKRHLKAGEHTVRVEYFQAEGEAKLFLAWKGADFDTTALSKWKPENWKNPIVQKTNEFTGLPLEPKTTPIIYRNFISGVGRRAIGVGFPGGLNYAWSVENFNLALTWRGAFIDAARHWRNRGGGHQPPAGFDVKRPTGLVPALAQLPAPDSPWPTFSPNEPQEDFQWKGYSLDASGIPSFRYTWKGVEIEDRLEAQGDFLNPDAKLIRKISAKGSLPSGALFLLANAPSAEPKDGSFLVRGEKFPIEGTQFTNEFSLRCEGALLRGNLLVVPLRSEIRIEYAWPQDPSAPKASLAPKTAQ